MQTGSSGPQCSLCKNNRMGLQKQLQNPSPQQHSQDSPTRHCLVVIRFIDGTISPIDGVVQTFLVWIFELLNLQLIRHKCVCHHAVDQKHERGGGAVDEGAQAAHHHHGGVSPGGKSILEEVISHN